MRPSHAEYARTLVDHHKQGVLSTVDRRDGAPYGSVVEYAPLEEGAILLFVSNLADHTNNMEADERSSLVVAEQPGEPQPLTRERVTLVGSVEQIGEQPETDEPGHVDGEATDDPLVDQMRSIYLEHHPHAETYIDFDDFSFWRLTPERLRYIGGFGRMSWVSAEEYRAAEADPIAPGAAGAVEHMNEDHADAMVLMARHLAEEEWVDQAEMTALDRYGFDLQVGGVDEEGEQTRETLRIGFEERLEGFDEVRPTMVEMTNRARQQSGEGG
jgi:hypothetical protein